MNIKISNVAKILEADISIKGITVIAGLNNTGKSTILKSMYMGLNSFKNTSGKIILERKKSIRGAIYRMESHFDDKGYIEIPQTLLDELSQMVNEKIEYFLLNKDDYEFFKQLFLDIVNTYKSFIKDEYIYSDEFIKPIYKQIKQVFEKTDDMYLKYIGDMYLRNVFSNQFTNERSKLEARIEIDTENAKNYISVKDNKIDNMSCHFLSGSDAIYIPTYNLLDYVNSGKMFMSAYSPEGSMRVFLNKLEAEEQSYEDYIEIEENVNSIKEILEEVVHGKLEKMPSGELRYRDNEIQSSINMTNVASGMKSFLLIQSLVERGKIRRDSVLLMDEPETNLHPEWHLIFAEILVLMYKNMGVISVVNSHSPYFIRALEVQMVNHGLIEKANFYLMEEKDRNLYIAKDVTCQTEKIYEKLYKPLEYL